MSDRRILLNRTVRIETGSQSKYEGVIEFMDEIGIMFLPSDKNLNPAYITWGDVKKIMIADKGE